MARIAYILLTHKDPEAVIAQALRLTAAGDYVAIHFDRRAGAPAYARIRTALQDNPAVVFAGRRYSCGWGEWSLVAATLAALTAALTHFPQASHFYLLSGDCMPIKSARYAHEMLDADEADYIECVDFFTSDWIRTGLKEERVIYRHLFNERKHKRLFYAALDWQRRLGLRRRPPADLQLMIGSQWWCLRRRTVATLLAFCARRRDVIRFFRTTWIPDETFFQTLVHHLVPEPEIRRRTLTFLMFTDYGMPVSFHNDHYDLLRGQNYLFARKISPDANLLKAKLGALYADDAASFAISDEGRALFHFLVGRGRVGRRYAPRFWEREASIGSGRELMILACKKGPVGKRLAERIRQAGNLPALGYIFNEEVEDLPDLGGIQSTLEKRNRHRRALMRMLFDHYDTNRLLVCIDPANIDLMRDFVADRCTTRILEVDCAPTDAFLASHARRIGLIGAESAAPTVEQVLRTLRSDLSFESDRLRDADFPEFHRIREVARPEENALPLAAFLGWPAEQALALAASPGLFD